MLDLITIGSATLDIIFKSKEFTLAPLDQGGIALCHKYGDKIDVEKCLMVSGGGATNVAVGAQRLGLKTAAVCEIGKDFPAQMVISDLEKEGVETQYVISERLEETGVSLLLVSEEGGRSILTHRGAAYELESRDIPWDRLYETRWLHIGSLGGEKQLFLDLFEYLHLYEIGVSWTPSKRDLQLLSEGQLRVDALRVDVLLLNAEEWQTLTDLHQQILQQISMIVVTDGRKGGQVFVDGQVAFPYNIIEVETKEETGAGDAFASGFISGMLYGKSLHECVEWGKRNAASVVKHLGAKEGLLTKEQLMKMENEG